MRVNVNKQSGGEDLLNGIGNLVQGKRFPIAGNGNVNGRVVDLRGQSSTRC